MKSFSGNWDSSNISIASVLNRYVCPIILYIWRAINFFWRATLERNWEEMGKASIHNSIKFSAAKSSWSSSCHIFLDFWFGNWEAGCGPDAFNYQRLVYTLSHIQLYCISQLTEASDKITRFRSVFLKKEKKMQQDWKQLCLLKKTGQSCPRRMTFLHFLISELQPHVLQI